MVRMYLTNASADSCISTAAATGVSFGDGSRGVAAAPNGQTGCPVRRSVMAQRGLKNAAKLPFPSEQPT